MVDRERVLQRSAVALTAKAVDHHGVGSSVKDIVWLASGGLIKAIAHESRVEEETIHAWESRSLEEVGVDKIVCLFSTLLLESWILSLKSEINNLFGWDVDGDGHLLDSLNDVVNLSICEFFVNVHGRRSEVRWVQDIVEWHEKHAIIGIFVTNLLEQLRSPSRVFIGPLSIVALSRPWISDLGKFVTSWNFDNIE